MGKGLTQSQGVLNDTLEGKREREEEGRSGQGVNTEPGSTQ